MTNILENITVQTKGQFLIYLISFEGKPAYVGQIYGKNQSAERRFRQHYAGPAHGRKLFEAIEEHGLSKFTYAVIDRADDREELNAKERHWIKFYDTYNTGLNGNVGGNSEFFTTAGKPIPQEHRERLRLLLTGRKHTEEARRLIGEASKGNKHVLGKKLGPCSDEKRNKIVSSMVGQKHTAARRKNQSAAALARFSDPAKKQAWLEARWGKSAKRTLSEEAKAKIKASALLHHTKKKEGLIV